MLSVPVALLAVSLTAFQLVNGQATLNAGQQKAVNAAKSIQATLVDMQANQNDESKVFQGLSSIMNQVKSVLEGSSATGQGTSGSGSSSYYAGSASGAPDPLNNDDDLSAAIMGAVGNSLNTQAGNSGSG